MTALPEKWSVPLAHGFSVIRVEAGGKKPMGRWKAYTTTAADRATVAEWAANNNCNVGIVTGSVSDNLVVTDFDKIEAEDEAKRRGMPPTVTVKTGRGRHYYFKCPPGRKPRKPSDFPDGMDLQFANKFVVAPGSIHPDGTEYVWERHPDVYDFADCPEWLLEPVENTRPKPVEARDDEDGPIITRETLDHLRGALGAIPSDDRDLWVKIGLALKTLPADKGNALWLEWSAKSDKFDEADALAKWDTMRPLKTHWRWVFEVASDEYGWVNPKAGTYADDEEADDDVIPADLWAGYPPPELPVGLLPPVIEAFARKHGEVMGVDPAGLAMAALAVASAAITDEIVVQVKQHDRSWRESARLWVGLVGVPSRKKTPIINVAAHPLRRIEATLAAEYAAELAAYDALDQAARQDAERPKRQRRIIQDLTVEAAQEVLKDNPWGLLSVQDELSGWFGSMDKYSPGKAAQADRGFWLQSFNGGGYNVDRISRGSVFIKNCSVCLLGGIQPEPMRKIAKDIGDDGLVQRFIPVVLRPAGTGLDVPTNVVVAEYADLIRDLVGHEGLVLHFHEDARAIRQSLEVKNLAAVQALETVSPKLSTHYGKYDGLFARLCVLWHVIEHADEDTIPATIPAAVAQRVAAFIDAFIRPSAVAFYRGSLGFSDDFDEVQALAAFILAERLDQVDARTVQRSGGFQTFTADAVRHLCEKLDAFGWLTPVGFKGAGKATRWRVNAHVHELFEDHGTRERERRELAREALRNAFNS